MGDVRLNLANGNTLILKDVRHVEGLRLNIISVGRLDKDGYVCCMGNHSFKITRGNLMIARGDRTSLLYLLKTLRSKDQSNALEEAIVRTDGSGSSGESPRPGQKHQGKPDGAPTSSTSSAELVRANQHEGRSDGGSSASASSGASGGSAEHIRANLWHRRLGHMGEKGLSTLVKDGILKDLKEVHLEECEDCLAGKHHRVSFGTGRSTSRSEKLELIHSDVCGPMQDQSFGGSKYFVTFIDDATRKVWVYPLKSKDQVLDVFQVFLAQAERQVGKKVKIVRSDNGGEFIGAFARYLKAHGIRHQTTPPKTPQLNGVAERMNRTLMEKVRCMLSHAKLPNSYWAEALVTAGYLINRSPCSHLKGVCPEKKWSGRSISLKHLRIFGCKAFAHVPQDERKKLDAKSRECIFIGYGEDRFGYKLYDPTNRKVIYSRDVVFFEDRTIRDSKETSSGGATGRSPILEEDEEPARAERSGDVELPAEEVQDDQLAQDEEGVEDHPEPSDSPQEPPIRRSTRIRQPSGWYSPDDYVMAIEDDEPTSYDEAMSGRLKDKWQEAMEEEMDSLKTNATYDLVVLPKGKRTLKNKWVFKIKNEPTGKTRYKARLVVKGFSQVKGIDYEEIFSPVVKMTSIRTVLGVAAQLDLEIEQMDVKTAFLHGDLEEEIYMEQPEGFVQTGRSDLVCRLNKSLYGLKQAPRLWYQKFDIVIREYGYKRCNQDHCVYVREVRPNGFIVLLLYVDDMLIIGKSGSEIAKLKAQLSKVFAMKDLGPAKRILGMEIERDRSNRRLYLTQAKYIANVLRRFRMDGVRPVSSPLAAHFKLSKNDCPETDEDREDMKNVPYASAVGSLMYAMVCTRPDIAYAVSTISRYMANPGRQHWAAVKWIMRYLQGTKDDRLCYSGSDGLLGYSDADMAGDLDGRKSTSGYLITYSGGAVSWQSKLQKCVALSTTEAEFIAVTEGCKEILWLKRFLGELGIAQTSYTLHCDNQSAIHLAKHSTFHARSKHIDVRYHWVRDIVNSKEIEFKDVRSNHNGADMLTKAVTKPQLQMCRSLAGLVDFSMS